MLCLVCQPLFNNNCSNFITVVYFTGSSFSSSMACSSSKQPIEFWWWFEKKLHPKVNHDSQGVSLIKSWLILRHLYVIGVFRLGYIRVFKWWIWLFLMLFSNSRKCAKAQKSQFAKWWRLTGYQCVFIHDHQSMALANIWSTKKSQSNIFIILIFPIFVNQVKAKYWSNKVKLRKAIKKIPLHSIHTL